MALPANFTRQFLLCVVLSLVGYGAWAAWSGADEVLAAARAIGWEGWGIILGLSLFNYLLRFVHWSYYLRRLNLRVPLMMNLLVYLGGFGFTTTPGKVGEAARSVYLKPYGVGYVHSLAAFFVAAKEGSDRHLKRMCQGLQCRQRGRDVAVFDL